MSSFPFLKLPQELRLPIYRHLLVKDIQPVRPKDLTEHDRTSGPFTAILFTNLAVYLEAYPTLLSDNVFELQMCSGNYNWLKNLGSQGRNELRSLTVLSNDIPYNPPYMHTATIFDLLSTCANLALNIKTNVGELNTLHSKGYLTGLHGYGRPSAVEITFIPKEDCVHSIRIPFHTRKRRDVLAEPQLRQLRSPCPQECKVYNEMATVPVRASVRVECDV